MIAGTGVLDDQHTTSRLALDVFRWSLAARLANARLVVLSVGAGPIDRRSGRILVRCALRLANDVSYRDAGSLQYMRRIGRNVAGDRVLPDLVLSMPPLILVRDCQQRAQQIAIGLLWQGNWHGRSNDYQDYEDKIVELIVRVTSKGWQVALVIGDESDVDTLQAILQRPELFGRPATAAATHSFHDVVEVATDSMVVVASRYHNLIAGAIAGRPVISLAYGPKNGSLLEQLETPERNHDVDAFSVDHVFDQICAAAVEHAPSFAARLGSYRSLLKREFETIIDGQNSPGRRPEPT